MTHTRKPYSRWKADTETAFVLALRVHGKVRDAAAACGVSLAAAYKRRERASAFACRWDEAVAEHRSAWDRATASPIGPEPDESSRFDGLTPVRRRAFLRALSETGNATEACQRVRVATATALRLRRSDAGFARAWEEALHRSGPILEQIAWERAVEGWEEPVYHHGVLVGTRRRYSDALLTALLRRDGAKVDPRIGKAGPEELRRIARDAARAAGGLFEANPKMTREQVERTLLRKLEAVERSLTREAAEEAAEEAAAAEAVADLPRLPPPA